MDPENKSLPVRVLACSHQDGKARASAKPLYSTTHEC